MIKREVMEHGSGMFALIVVLFVLLIIVGVIVKNINHD